MLFSLTVVKLDTPCVALVHDCQVVNTVLQPEIFDIVCDLVVTPTRTVDVALSEEPLVPKPTCGTLWEQLQPNMLEDIPPLRELQVLEHLRRQSRFDAKTKSWFHEGKGVLIPKEVHVES